MIKYIVFGTWLCADMGKSPGVVHPRKVEPVRAPQILRAGADPGFLKGDGWSKIKYSSDDYTHPTPAMPILVT